jgi:hypothetical protein
MINSSICSGRWLLSAQIANRTQEEPPGTIDFAALLLDSDAIRALYAIEQNGGVARSSADAPSTGGLEMLYGQDL